jgi:hypothetical protein
MELSVMDDERREGRPTQPSWGQLIGRVALGLVEVLIPLAFVAAMVYWRAPWLFRAIAHFFAGESPFAP